MEKFSVEKNGKLISKHLKMDAFLELLQQYGLELFDVTGVSRTGMRQEEIYDWLRGRHDVESFVVLDDDSYDLSCFVGRELVKTSFSLDGEMIFDMEVCSGLCQEHVVQAVSILNKEKVRQKER